jgi:quercetin dioxygenase-like cupin family protein
MKIIAGSKVPSERADPHNFKGDVWRSEIVTRSRKDGLRGHRFVYAPGARSNWHIHTGEQVLIVIEGHGLIQWRRSSPRSLQPGDWVYVEPGVRHWHGSAADSIFSHLAVTATGDVEWLEPVSDAHYQSVKL